MSVCPPPSPASPALPGAQRARSLSLRSGRAGGFGLRRGGEAGERVSARGGSECQCESPVPGARATQRERRGARAGAEPESAAVPRRQAPPRTHPLPRRLPARRAARSPRAPRRRQTPAPGPRRPPACPEAVRGSPGDVTAAPRSPQPSSLPLSRRPREPRQ